MLYKTEQRQISRVKPGENAAILFVSTLALLVIDCVDLVADMFADIRKFIEITSSSLIQVPRFSCLEASHRGAPPSHTSMTSQQSEGYGNLSRGTSLSHSSVTGQHSDDVGHLTSGFNYVDANISCKAYDKFACPLLYN